MFDKVLIANRGAIACRIIRTLRQLSVSPVAVYSRADAHSLHVSLADEAICIGEALASDTYLDTGRILEAARRTGVQAIHPGYGFLSENAGFAEECEANGIRFIGPNCIGVINMENGFCVPFPRLTPFIRPGEVSVVSQSGGVGLSIMNHMAAEGIGLNKFTSAGNMLNIDAEDLLEYYIEDDGTKIIFVYLESIRDGRRLMEIARRSHKPILAMKSNIGRLGQSIAASHTASLSSDDRVVDAAFDQCGITRVHDVTTLSQYMKTLRLPPLKDKRLAIISRSGGHAIVAADACETVGFELAEFPESFIREIEKQFRASVIDTCARRSSARAILGPATGSFETSSRGKISSTGHTSAARRTSSSRRMSRWVLLRTRVSGSSRRLIAL